MRKLGLRTATLGALAITAFAGLPSNAGAAENVPSAESVIQAAPNRCGSGYGRVDSENLNALGPNFGTVYLYYNRTNGNNCVFTEKAVARGTRTSVTALLCRGSDGQCVSDSGNYLSYAGPVYLFARGQCVRWGGSVTNTDGRRDSFTSAFEHCGS